MVDTAEALLAPTLCVTFDRMAELQQHVEDVDARTFRSTVHQPEDVHLDDNGQLPDGYRLTLLAFNQLCQAVAPGLSRLAAEIAGIKRTDKMPDVAVSAATAARIINACVALRFRAPNGLFGRQLIRYADRHIVDGIVGRGYNYVSNHLLLEMAQSILCDGDVPMGFVQAQLAGRRLAAMFSQTQAELALVGGQQFRIGCYIGNSEAGECSVRVAPVLHLEGTECRCMGTPILVSHIGQQLQTRLVAAFVSGTAALQELSADFTQTASARMQQPLHLLDKHDKIRVSYRRQLVGGLVSRGVPQPIAEDVIRWAIFAGGTAAVFPRHVSTEQLRDRYVYDIFIRLLTQAMGRHPRVRELMEHAAFLLLTKNWKQVTYDH
jgi:hypothetical protein